jgi:arginase
MDSHTPETSVSKAYHGMPVAVLMGYGESDLANINRYKASIKPENIVQIGIRSFEGGEARLLHSLGAKVFTMDDVRSLGLKETLEIAVDYLKRRVKHFGLSIDLDAFDPEDSPGTGTPVANGIKFDEFYQNLDLLYNDSGIIGLEIVEFNPLRDQSNKTLNIIMKLVEKLIKEESYAVFARKSSNINKW